jgi:hypothetical protein
MFHKPYFEIIKLDTHKNKSRKNMKLRNKLIALLAGNQTIMLNTVIKEDTTF